MTRKTAHPISLLALLACCIPFIFSGCSSSHLASVWRDPSYNRGPLKSIVIISISRDPIKRRLWEDAFVSELVKYSVTATPSYALFPDSLPDTNQINDVIDRNGYDGMLIISRLRTHTQVTTVEPSVTEIPVAVYNPWRKEYVTRYEEDVEPGYTDSTKIVRHRIEIWAAKESSHMIWSGICLTEDPVSSQQVHDEAVGLIAPLLSKSGLLPPKQ